MEPVDVAFALLGVGALLAGVLPRVLERRPLSMPIAFLGLGMLVFVLPTGLPTPDPLRWPELTTHLTEVGVIVALMGAGLKIDRPLSWARWSSTWRLLAIAMPLCIAAVALLGWWWAGLVPAAALLLGAALAPTDPVLASDVQVGEPTDVEDSEDEVRFALTSEAGLNDGLAFPFVYAAIAIATTGLAPSGWLAEWFAVDVFYKLAAGVGGGLLVGWLLGKLFFRAPSKLRLARHSEGFLALAATFLAYGLVEVIGGYGFLAVFVAARAIRAAERTHEFHSVLHDFAEQVERLLTVLLLLLFGGAVIGGLLAPLTWPAALAGLALVLVIRPLAAWLSLRGAPGRPAEHWVISLFGIRGVGSFYYLAYATSKTDFPQADLVWATVGLVVVVSVVAHGIAATPVMQLLDREGERTGEDTRAGSAAQPVGATG
ncbi:cation:proton antiporter [Micromonospora aurantiaca]|uniref:Sodium:proton antiporter n=1 Tax=Micromonospora aurantiaca (nom. illeg.) TaxID=47850 RepID=A0ABQ6UI63_9ACTN|nr:MULTISPECIES: cation:proton antiporter [Micromonospora]KAB1116535.1 sodium:proton antiporter [Micromonospora aurantiaca]MBC9006580.1 cation:proton antiporter [Micromonospora aurantiaca]MDG4750639.1 cation:proton antiporter [Micromonospora sp. WMMD718]MDW3847264.1 cation:proton antiporter [Micromonospora sp. BRA006-A]UFN96548.1 cation:proton antiporter [Micromonospora aurantiaca]